MSQVRTGEKTQQAWRIAAWTAFTVAALHYANLAHLVGATDDQQAWTTEASSTSPFVFEDTRSYASRARSALTQGLLGIDVLHKPPGFPALLHVSRCLTGTFFTILLLVPLVVAAAAAATVLLTWRVTASVWVSVLAAMLFALWPGQFQFTPVLLTDAMHANLAVVALYCSLEWFESRRTAWGLAAGPLWMSTLWLRPTLIFLPALVAGLIVVRLIRRRPVHWVVWLNLAFCAAPPGYMLIQNVRRHNLPVVAAVGMENLAVWVVARTREEMGEGRFKELRRTIGEKYREIDSAKQRYEAKKRDFIAFVREHPWPTAIGLARETVDQALYPSRPYLRREMRGHYPPWMQITSNGMIAIWCFAALGLAVLFRRLPALAIFLVACSFFVMGVASIGHLAGARLRLPVDLLLMPATALGVAATASWVWHGARRAATLPGRATRWAGLTAAHPNGPERVAQASALVAHKPALRRLYAETYERYQSCVARCPAHGAVLELGSGAGFARDYLPDLVTSDIVPHADVDEVVDATNMPFEAESLRAILMLNVFHHLSDVAAFLREVERCLVPGGRILIVDQHPGWLSTIIYRHLHDEGFDPDASDWRLISSGPLSGANGALAWIVFQRDRHKLADVVPRLHLESYNPHTPLRYWMAGGLKTWSLLPGWAFGLASRVDRALMQLSKDFGSFVDVELVKTARQTESRDDSAPDQLR